MNTTETSSLHLAILSAAEALHAYQLDILRAERDGQNALTREYAARDRQSKAYRAFTEAELRHAQVNALRLETVKARKLSSEKRYELESEHYRALKNLMGSCATGDNAAILAAAEAFSACNDALNAASEREIEAGAAFGTAFLSSLDAEKHLHAARQEHEEACAALEEAVAESKLRFSLVPCEREGLLQLQAALANAAAALGRTKIKEDFSPFTNSCLGLKLPPEDEMPPAHQPNPLEDSQVDFPLDDDKYFVAQPCEKTVN